MSLIIKHLLKTSYNIFLLSILIVKCLSIAVMQLAFRKLYIIALSFVKLHTHKVAFSL